MAITLNGTTGITTPDITSEAGLTVDGVSFASGAPANTLVTTSGGNVGIGTSSPSRKLDVRTDPAVDWQLRIGANNTSADTYDIGRDVSDGLLYFYGNQTGYNGYVFSGVNGERARIDSSGNLLVGTTAFVGAGGMTFSPSALAPRSHYAGSSTSNANTTLEVYSTGVPGYRFYVGYGGTVYATNTSISAVSDIRFKENVRDLDAGLSEVMALKPRKFDWKEGKGANIQNARGFIAQEFEEVFPDLIDEWRDPAPEGEEPYKSVPRLNSCAGQSHPRTASTYHGTTNRN